MSFEIVARLREYSPGEAEVSWGVRLVGSETRKVRGERRGSPSPDRERHKARSVIRARACVRRKVQSARLNYLLTLTTRAAIRDFVEWRQLVDRFLRMVRDNLRDYPYVAVSERHDSERTSEAKRGSWHEHLAVRGWQNVRLLRTLWLRVCGDGNIDVKSPRGGGGPWLPQRLAQYLAKYVTKTIKEADVGRHRYRASLGLDLAPEEKIFPVTDGTESVLKWLVEREGRVTFMVASVDRRDSGWACTW